MLQLSIDANDTPVAEDAPEDVPEAPMPMKTPQWGSTGAGIPKLRLSEAADALEAEMTGAKGSGRSEPPSARDCLSPEAIEAPLVGEGKESPPEAKESPSAVETKDPPSLKPVLSSLAARRGMKLQNKVDTSITRVAEDDCNAPEEAVKNPIVESKQESEAPTSPQLDNNRKSSLSGGLAARRSMMITIKRPQDVPPSPCPRELSPPRPPIRNINPWKAAKTKVQALKAVTKAASIITSTLAKAATTESPTDLGSPGGTVVPKVASMQPIVHRRPSIIKGTTSPRGDVATTQPNAIQRRPSINLSGEPVPCESIGKHLASPKAAMVAHTPAGPRKDIWEESEPKPQKREDSKKESVDHSPTGIVLSPSSSSDHSPHRSKDSKLEAPAVKTPDTYPRSSAQKAVDYPLQPVEPKPSQKQSSWAAEDAAEARSREKRLEEALLAAETNAQSHLRSCEAAKEQCEELQKAMASMKAAEETWENKLSEEVQRTISLQSALVLAGEVSASVEAAEKTAQRKESKAMQEASSLRETLACCKSEVDQLTIQEKSIASKGNDLRSEVELLEASLSEWKSEVNAARSEAQRVSSAAKIECKEMQSATQDQANMLSKIEQVASKLSEVELRANFVESNEARMKTEFEEMKTAANNSAQRSASTESKIAQLESTLKTVESHAETLENDKEKALAEGKDLHLKIDTLEAFLKDANSTGNIFKAEAERSQAELETRLAELTALEKKHANLETAERSALDVRELEEKHSKLETLQAQTAKGVHHVISRVRGDDGVNSDAGDRMLHQQIVQLKDSLQATELDAERMGAKATQGVFLGEELRCHVRKLQDELVQYRSDVQGYRSAMQEDSATIAERAEAEKVQGLDKALIAAGDECHNLKQALMMAEEEVQRLTSEAKEAEQSRALTEELLQEQVSGLVASLKATRQDVGTKHAEWLAATEEVEQCNKEVQNAFERSVDAKHRVETARLQELGALEESQKSNQKAKKLQEELQEEEKVASKLSMENDASRAKESTALRDELDATEKQLEELRPTVSSLELSLAAAHEELVRSRQEANEAAQARKKPHALMGDMEALLVDMDARYKQVDTERTQAQSLLDGATEQREQTREQARRREEQLRAAYDRRVADVVQQLYEERTRCRAQREETGRMRLDALAARAHAAELWDVTRDLRKELEKVVSAQREEMQVAQENLHRVHKSRCSTSAQYVKQFDAIADKLWLGVQKHLEQWESRLAPIRLAFNQGSGSACQVPTPTRERVQTSNARSKSPATPAELDTGPSLSVTAEQGNVRRCGYNPERYMG